MQKGAIGIDEEGHAHSPIILCEVVQLAHSFPHLAIQVQHSGCKVRGKGGEKGKGDISTVYKCLKFNNSVIHIPIGRTIPSFVQSLQCGFTIY